MPQSQPHSIFISLTHQDECGLAAIAVHVKDGDTKLQKLLAAPGR